MDINTSLSNIEGLRMAGEQSAAGPKPTVDKEAFLKLLIAQLSNQDPTKPMDGTEFVTQLAQFTSVEQALAQSEKLDGLNAQLTGLNNHNATQLVGKWVTVENNGSIFLDGGKTNGASATLTDKASEVTATILDANGNVVRTIPLGGGEKGAVMAVPWDGKNQSGGTMPDGAYSVKVEATNADGEVVKTSTTVSGQVQEVIFENGIAVAILKGNVRADVNTLVGVKAGP